MKNVKKRISKIPGFCLFLLLICLTSHAQQGNIIKGTVVDDNGDPVIGASVMVKGNSTTGTITDFDGVFSLNVPEDSKTLVVSFIGMTTQEVTIGGRKSFRIVLQDDNVQLNEVIVVGYGQQKKASVVGAITQTSGKVLERAGGVSNIGSALTGNLPGVVTTQSTGVPGEEDPQITIRGASSWNNSDPLIFGRWD